MARLSFPHRSWAPRLPASAWLQKNWSVQLPLRPPTEEVTKGSAARAIAIEDRDHTRCTVVEYAQTMLITGRTLFAFVDPNDPYTPSEIAGEEQPGPILSLMAARQFDFLFLFFTPQMHSNAEATRNEIRLRYEKCHVMVHELPVSDPKDYSSLMGRLARQVRDIMRSSRDAENSICVSSGTAEMRAAWFLLKAAGVLPATLLQVGSPARPLFGAANVKEVRLDTGDWRDLRDLVMPQAYFSFAAGRAPLRVVAKRRREAFDSARVIGHVAERISALADQMAKVVTPELRPADGLPPAPVPKVASPELGVAEAQAISDGARVESHDRAAVPASVFQQECINVLAEAGRLLARAHAQTLKHAQVISHATEVELAASMRFATQLEPRRPVPPPGLEEALQELGIFVDSAVVRQAAEQAAIMAQSDLARVVLLQGETGTGKELFAKLIHRMSDRNKREMVTVNCAMIQKDLSESLLFGHVRGAFTGALANRQGKFDAARGSTLFLDELAELTPEVQAKLLRVIEDFQVEPLGSNDSHAVDVRVIAATNRDLEAAVDEGRFRQDLYFRLKGRRIVLPPLRKRQGEIPYLAVALLHRINQRCRRPRQLSKEALRCLERHDWPGNVRELASVLESAVLWSQNDVLGPEDIRIETSGRDDSIKGLPEPHAGFVLDDFLQKIKKQLIDRALEKTEGNQKAAGDLLGWSKQRISAFVLGQSDNGD